MAIQINTLREVDKGKQVIYTSNRDGEKEIGKITSLNDMFIFVDYAGNGRGIATAPHHLEFIDDDNTGLQYIEDYLNVKPLRETEVLEDMNNKTTVPIQNTLHTNKEPVTTVNKESTVITTKNQKTKNILFAYSFMIFFLYLIIGNLTTCVTAKRIGAECCDGTISDATESGACSYHGGVQRWRKTYWYSDMNEPWSSFFQITLGNVNTDSHDCDR